MRDENGKFLKGFSGNPAGKPKGTKELSPIRALVKEKIYEVCELLVIDRELAMEKLKEPNAPLIFAIMAKAIQNNNWKVINDILNRVLGLPSQSIEIQELKPERVFSFPDPKIKIDE